ncbi:hypothetical protein [Amycolatopsis sp. WAC 04197]|uniref:hypothetical protein n=1 Tax=Amycolatopsis sp. WAC 04197 TaxID=2203199 RepID=UPI000F76EBD3|nr:hypothetical protein [Amycolatopsis sp. WAC 04197]
MLADSKQELLNWLRHVIDFLPSPEHLGYPCTEALVTTVGRWFTPGQRFRPGVGLACNAGVSPMRPSHTRQGAAAAVNRGKLV